jgi:hypothetical protein
MGDSTISMAIFNSYVKLPEGMIIIISPDPSSALQLPHLKFGEAPLDRHPLRFRPR